jgi:predicted thioesterase
MSEFADADGNTDVGKWSLQIKHTTGSALGKHVTVKAGIADVTVGQCCFDVDRL